MLLPFGLVLSSIHCAPQQLKKLSMGGDYYFSLPYCFFYGLTKTALLTNLTTCVTSMSSANNVLFEEFCTRKLNIGVFDDYFHHAR
jgi:hypothetical protein